MCAAMQTENEIQYAAPPSVPGSEVIFAHRNYQSLQFILVLIN